MDNSTDEKQYQLANVAVGSLGNNGTSSSPLLQRRRKMMSDTHHFSSTASRNGSIIYRHYVRSRDASPVDTHRRRNRFRPPNISVEDIAASQDEDDVAVELPKVRKRSNTMPPDMKFLKPKPAPIPRILAEFGIRKQSSLPNLVKIQSPRCTPGHSPLSGLSPQWSPQHSPARRKSVSFTDNEPLVPPIGGLQSPARGCQSPMSSCQSPRGGCQSPTAGWQSPRGGWQSPKLTKRRSSVSSLPSALHSQMIGRSQSFSISRSSSVANDNQPLVPSRRSCTLPSIAALVGIVLFKKRYMARLNQAVTKEIAQKYNPKPNPIIKDIIPVEEPRPQEDLPVTSRFASNLSTEAQTALLESYDDLLLDKLGEDRPLYKAMFQRHRSVPNLSGDDKVSQHIQGAMDIVDSIKDSRGQHVTSNRHHKLINNPIQDFKKWRESWKQSEEHRE